MAHPNKEIRKAIETAEQMGWRFEKSNARAHAYGKLYCPNECLCLFHVYGTPRNPENHAKRILKAVAACPRDED